MTKYYVCANCRRPLSCIAYVSDKSAVPRFCPKSSCRCCDWKEVSFRDTVNIAKILYGIKMHSAEGVHRECRRNCSKTPCMCTEICGNAEFADRCIYDGLDCSTDWVEVPFGRVLECTGKDMRI